MRLPALPQWTTTVSQSDSLRQVPGKVPPDGAPPENSRRVFAMILMIISSVVISFGGLVVRSMEVADTWQINFYRSVAFLAAVALVVGLRHRRNVFASIRAIGRPGLLAGSIVSIAGVAFLQSLTHTTVANTLFTMSAIPFMTAVLARIFLRESLAPATVITMAIAALGIIAMVAEGVGAGSTYGNAMALITVCSFSSYAVILRHNRRVDMLPTLLVSGTLIGAISLVMRFDDLALPLWDIGLCFLWGGLMSGMVNWFFILASRHLAAAELTLFMLLEFSLGPLWVWWFLNEVPSRWTMIGGGVVILSVAVRAFIELRERPVSGSTDPGS